jgi:ABC-type methionine transport system permease subunit
MNDFGDRSLVNIQLVQPSAAVGATAGGGICSTMLSVDGFEKAYKEIVSSKVREKI